MGQKSKLGRYAIRSLFSRKYRNRVLRMISR
jgi:hypothetical protein